MGMMHRMKLRVSSKLSSVELKDKKYVPEATTTSIFSIPITDYGMALSELNPHWPCSYHLSPIFIFRLSFEFSLPAASLSSSAVS
jgi:hypothetical protein